MWDADKYRDTLCPENRACGFCKGQGWHEITGELQWCVCDAARDRKLVEPDLIETIRAERVRFAEKFS